MFLGEAIGPFDQIRQFAPWNGPKPGDAWDVLQADGVIQFYVWRDLVFESWRNFQVPFWNPYQLGGTPLLANSQSGALYPPHILLGVLHIPTPLAITLLAWFHLFWAGLGTFKLVRALGGTELGGVVAGASFALSPFMLSWTSLSSVITTVAWIPWALYGVVSLFNLPSDLVSKIKGGDVVPIRRHQWRATWLLAISIGMMILGGHLQFVAYGVLATVLLLLGLLLLRTRDLHGLKLSDDSKKESFVEWQERSGFAEVTKALIYRVALGLVLGVCIAAPQLLPILQHSQTSHRRNVPTDEGYAAYLGSAIKPFELANLVTTKALGDPRSPVEINENLTVAEYWPPLAKNGANFAESAVTIGPLVLGLLFLVPWRDRRTWPIAALGILALLLAMGTALNKPLYFLVPGWSSTGSPGRIIVLFVLAACVLAGLAVGKASKRQLTLAMSGVVGITGFTINALPSFAPAWLGGGDQLASAVWAVAKMGTIPNLLIALTFGAGIFLLGGNLKPKEEKGQIDPQALIVALPVLFALVSFLNLIPTGKPLAPAIEKPPLGRVAIVNDNWSILAAAPGVLLPPNLAALSRIKELAGYDSLLHKDTKAMLDDLNGQDSAPPANGNIMFIKPTADRQKLIDAGVDQVWSVRPLAGWEDVSPRLENGYWVYVLDVTNYSYASEGDGGANQETPGRIEVSWEEDVPEVHIKERWMPGWSATNGAKVEPLEGGWIKVVPAPGTEEATLTYTSPGYSAGLLLAIPAWLLVLVGAAFGGRRSVLGKSDKSDSSDPSD